MKSIKKPTRKFAGFFVEMKYLDIILRFLYCQVLGTKHTFLFNKNIKSNFDLPLITFLVRIISHQDSL